MANDERVQGGSDGEGDRPPPLSRAEQLMQAHPDITVIRDLVGDIDIVQTLPEYRWRHLTVDIEHEEGSQRHYPAVIVRAWQGSTRTHATDDLGLSIRRHGLETIVRVHTEDDEQVTPEVGYDKRLPYPSDFTNRLIKYIEEYSYPIPSQELVATARIGLEMLTAYQGASRKQRARIDATWTGYHGWSQIVDETRPDMDTYIADASPLLGEAMRREGISYTHVGTKSIYALNALNKVTDSMLPQEMPPAPQNRREPRRKATPELQAPRRITALRRRTPRG